MTEPEFLEVDREQVVQLLTAMWTENQRLHADIRTKDAKLAALEADLHVTRVHLEHVSAGVGYVTSLIDMAARIVKVADRVDAEQLAAVPVSQLTDVFLRAKAWADEAGKRRS